MSEYCVCCGEEIPEGRMICPICEKNYGGDDNEGLDPEVRERYKGFTDESSSSYSLW